MASHAYGDTKSEEINAMGKQNKFRSKPVTKPTEMLTDCMYCGQSHERLKARTPAFGKTCRGCGRTNHFIGKCTYKPGNTRATVQAKGVKEVALSTKLTQSAFLRKNYCQSHWTQSMNLSTLLV